MKFVLAILGLSVCVTTAGCFLFPGSTPPNDEGMCQTDDECVESVFTDEHWRLQTLADLCEGTWTWTAACSRANVAGVCTWNGEFGRSQHFYSADIYTPATAETTCATEVNGTFATSP